MGVKNFAKKVKLSKKGNQTKWAPVWAVMRKFGPGRKVHPSVITHVKRTWKRNKLRIKPRKMRKSHMG